MKSIFIDFQNINTFSFNGKLVAQFAYETFDSETELRDKVTKQLIISNDDLMSFAEVHELAVQAVHAFERDFMENQ